MSGDSETKCPCCRGTIEYFPDQDGSCDYQCIHCGWSEHVPSSENIAAALTLRKGDQPGSEPEVKPQLPRRGRVDLELLKQQAAFLGKVVDKSPLTDGERSCLEDLSNAKRGGAYDCLKQKAQCREGAFLVGPDTLCVRGFSLLGGSTNGSDRSRKGALEGKDREAH